jgi:hypothetical protein
MSKIIWKQLGSPELIPSAITLRAYDGHPSQPEGLYQNVLVELGGKTIIIDIEVIDAPLDYNILFGRSYMYAMKVVTSSIFRTMLFPHNGKIITIDQLTHYEPNHSRNIDNVLPLIRSSFDISSIVDIGPGIFRDPSLVGSYKGDPPSPLPTGATQVCVVTSDGIEILDESSPKYTSPKWPHRPSYLNLPQTISTSQPSPELKSND